MSLMPNIGGYDEAKQPGTWCTRGVSLQDLPFTDLAQVPSWRRGKAYRYPTASRSIDRALPVPTMHPGWMLARIGQRCPRVNHDTIGSSRINHLLGSELIMVACNMTAAALGRMLRLKSSSGLLPPAEVVGRLALPPSVQCKTTTLLVDG